MATEGQGACGKEEIPLKFAVPELAFGNPEGDLHRSFIQCSKDPTHEQFIPVKDLHTELLPKDFADNDIVQTVKALADLTVRIRAKVISPDRPEKFPGTEIPYPFYIPGGGTLHRSGSGFVSMGQQEMAHHRTGTEANPYCDCWECKESSNPKSEWWDLMIITSLHVLYDSVETQAASIDFFYDDDLDKSGVVTLRGYASTLPCLQILDRAFVIARTHNAQLVKRLEDTWRHFKTDLINRIQLKYGYKRTPSETDELSPLPVMVISHPHGCRKYLTVGRTIKERIQGGGLSYSNKTCPGSSGGLVFLFGQEFLYCFSPHAQSLRPGVNRSGMMACGVMNPRFY